MTEGSHASEKLVIVFNGEAIVEYDRNRKLPESQQEYLDKMDRAMDAGIIIGEQTVEAPNISERAAFVANNLIEAVRANDEPMIAATCAYLANRLPELRQVKAEEKELSVEVDLIFDEHFTPEVRVSLT